MKEVMEEGRLLDDDTDLDLDSHMIKGHSVDLQLHNRSTSIKLILYIELVHIILFLLAICLWDALYFLTRLLFELLSLSISAF